MMCVYVVVTVNKCLAKLLSDSSNEPLSEVNLRRLQLNVSQD